MTLFSYSGNIYRDKYYNHKYCNLLCINKYATVYERQDPFCDAFSKHLNIIIQSDLAMLCLILLYKHVSNLMFCNSRDWSFPSRPSVYICISVVAEYFNPASNWTCTDPYCGSKNNGTIKSISSSNVHLLINQFFCNCKSLFAITI